ncbi:MAG: cupin domain-containing protein [Methyloprofundus sp.]|nr:cupin domain-containing protein [Methyloprofundus sp.]
MFIKKSGARVEVKNILADIPQQVPEELFSRLLEHENIQIERIVSRGHCSEKNAWYDQENNEWVLLIQGSARLEFAQQTEFTELHAGDYLLIPAHCRHRVAWTDPEVDSIWLAIHF